jgi:hypothetical protein
MEQIEKLVESMMRAGEAAALAVARYLPTPTPTPRPPRHPLAAGPSGGDKAGVPSPVPDGKSHRGCFFSERSLLENKKLKKFLWTPEREIA